MKLYGLWQWTEALASVYVQRKSTISGGVPNKVLNGEAPPRCPNPLTLFFSIFDRKSTPFSIVSAFQSIPFLFFYVLTFRLFLLWNGLLFCLINYLCISTYFKSTEISKIWFLAIWAWYKNYFRDNYLPKTQLNVIHQLIPHFVIQYNFAVFDAFDFPFLCMIINMVCLGQNNSL